MAEQLTHVDKEELRALVAEILDIDQAEVTDHAHFVDDLDVDSLMALEITVRLEKAYGVRLTEGEMGSIRTLESTYDLLLEKLRQPQ
jgi:acyl carrier protein